jgi:hypothetical protein
VLPPLPPDFDVAFEVAPLVFQDKALSRGGDGDGDGDGGGEGDGEGSLGVGEGEGPGPGRPSGFAPKGVLCRRFPSRWTLLVDADGGGYAEARDFGHRPELPPLLDAFGKYLSGEGSAGPLGGDLGSVDGAPLTAARREPAVPSTPASVALPVGVECRTWAEIDSSEQLMSGWYTAGCILRLRDASARGRSQSDRDAFEEDQSERALHLFAAEPCGWRATPVALSASALLLLDAAADGSTDEEGGDRPIARLAQLAIAGDATWGLTVLEAAEALAKARKQGGLAVQASEGTAWWAACTQRGYAMGYAAAGAAALDAVDVVEADDWDDAGGRGGPWLVKSFF